MTKIATSLRLSPGVDELINALAIHHGINRTAVVEMAVRHLARRDGVAISGTESKKATKR
jgi:hypothetical protein